MISLEKQILVEGRIVSNKKENSSDTKVHLLLKKEVSGSQMNTSVTNGQTVAGDNVYIQVHE